MKPAAKTEKRIAAGRPGPSPRVVYTHPPVLLASVVAREEGRWRVRAGDRELLARPHDSLDPALLDEAIRTGAQVVLDNGAEPTIAGVLLTARPLTLDREGDVIAKVRRIVVEAEHEALFKTPRAFLQLSVRDVELYGVRIAARARDVVKLLGSMVKLN